MPPLRMMAPSGAPMKNMSRQATASVSLRCHSIAEPGQLLPPVIALLERSIDEVDVVAHHVQRDLVQPAALLGSQTALELVLVSVRSPAFAEHARCPG